MATRAENPFYIDAVVRQPGIFASFVQGYLGYKVPVAMAWMQARMAAADPSKRQALAAELMSQATRLRDRWAAAQASSERAKADVDIAFKTLVGEGVKFEGAKLGAESAERVAETNAGSARYTADTNREVAAAEIKRDYDMAGIQAEVSLKEKGVLDGEPAEVAKEIDNAIRLFSTEYTNALRVARETGSDPDQDPAVARAMRNLQLQTDAAIQSASLTPGQRAALSDAVRGTLDRIGQEDVREGANDAIGDRFLLDPSAIDIPPAPEVGSVENTTRPVQRRGTTFQDVVDEAVRNVEAMGGATPASTSTTRSQSSSTSTSAPTSPSSAAPTARGLLGPAPTSTSSGAPAGARSLPHAGAVVDDPYQPLLSEADRLDALARETMAGTGSGPLGGFFDPIPGGPPRRGRGPAGATVPQPPPVPVAPAPLSARELLGPAPAAVVVPAGADVPMTFDVAGAPTRAERQRRRAARVGPV